MRERERARGRRGQGEGGREGRARGYRSLLFPPTSSNYSLVIASAPLRSTFRRDPWIPFDSNPIRDTEADARTVKGPNSSCPRKSWRCAEGYSTVPLESVIEIFGEAVQFGNQEPGNWSCIIGEVTRNFVMVLSEESTRCLDC